MAPDPPWGCIPITGGCKSGIEEVGVEGDAMLRKAAAQYKREQIMKGRLERWKQLQMTKEAAFEQEKELLHQQGEERQTKHEERAPAVPQPGSVLSLPPRHNIERTPVRDTAEARKMLYAHEKIFPSSSAFPERRKMPVYTGSYKLPKYGHRGVLEHETSIRPYFKPAAVRKEAAAEHERLPEIAVSDVERNRRTPSIFSSLTVDSDERSFGSCTPSSRHTNRSTTTERLTALKGYRKMKHSSCTASST